MKRKNFLLICSMILPFLLEGAVPVAEFSQSATSVCVGAPVNFTDLSTNTPTSWAWTFPGGTPGTSTAQNPIGVTWASAGSKTVTLVATNLSGSGTITHTITINALPTVSTSTSANTICQGNSVTITGNGAVTYTWMPGSLSGNPITVFPATSTTYTVTGTNSNGCTNTATRPITVNPSPTVTATATSSTICSGNSTSLSAAGASTYNWMPGNHNGQNWTVSPASTTTYTVTGTQSGCTGTATLLITVNPTPTVTTTTTGGTICSGNSTSITASGATTYSWMPGSLNGTTVTVSPVSTTTYTVTGTSIGCSGTATRTITVNPTPTVTTTTTGGTICSGNSTNMTASGASTYSWMPGSLTGTTVTVSPATTTTYTVTGTSASGCSNTATRTITVNASPTVTTTTTFSTICSGSSTGITASGATTYSWMPGSLTGTTITVSPAATTTYTVTGTTTGCTGTSTVTIAVNPTPTVTTTTTGGTICSGNSTSITASGATTYSWMPGSLTGTTVTVSPVATTTYTVTGTTTGCDGTATRTITVNASPTVIATATSTSICTGSSTSLSATGATTYNWMPGNHNGTPWTVSPIITTTYTVTGTTSGCTGTATLLITVTPTPTVSTTTTGGTICSGNSTSITASGATTYSWMPGSLTGTTVSVSPSTTTTYTVTGTTVGCTGTATRTITVNPSPTLTTSATSNSICSGNSTTITVSGATTYNWMPGSLTGTSNTVSPATTTTYTVTGTSGSCTGTATQLITVTLTPTVTATTTGGAICFGDSTIIVAAGATSYAWMPGSLTGTTVTVSPSTTTTYTITGTTGGCTGTATQLITVNPLPSIVALVDNPVVCIGTIINLSAGGALSYLWQPINIAGSSVADSPVSSTSYSVTGTDMNGCSDTASVFVTVNSLPSVSADATPSAICIGNSVTLSATGATTYNWLPQNATGANVIDNPNASITYTVVGTDINGCTNTATVFVTVNDLPIISVSGDTLICLGASASLTASGASTYAWMPGSLNGGNVIVSPSSTTTYSVTGTDTNGCSNSGTISVTVDTPPSSPTISVNGVVLTSTVTGNSYQWFLNGNPIAGATSQSYTATQNGSYTVEVYDAAGCGSGESSAVLDPAGIESESSIDFISIFPNPNSGIFQMNFYVVDEGKYVLEIHDVLGRVIYSEHLNNFQGAFSKEMDLSSYGKGVYFVYLKNEKSDSTSKHKVLRVVIY